MRTTRSIIVAQLTDRSQRQWTIRGLLAACPGVTVAAVRRIVRELTHRHQLTVTEVRKGRVEVYSHGRWASKLAAW